MSVEVILKFSSAAEAAAALAMLVATPGKSAPADSPAASPPSAAATPTPTPTKAPKATPAPSPAATQAPTAAPATQPTESSDPLLGPYEKSGLGELVQKTVQGGKRAEVVAVLAKYGAKKANEVKVEDRAAFKAEVEALLAPSEDLG